MSGRTQTNLIIGVLSVAIVGLGAWVVYATFQVVEKTLPAVVAGCATLLVAVLTHYLTRLREQELKYKQLKQDNYLRILDLIAPFVRGDGEGKDNFETAHLHSWIVGSQDVIQATRNFVVERTTENLAKLLAAMRADLGIIEIESTLAPQVFAPRAVGGIAPPAQQLQRPEA